MQHHQVTPIRSRLSTIRFLRQLGRVDHHRIHCLSQDPHRHMRNSMLPLRIHKARQYYLPRDRLALSLRQLIKPTRPRSSFLLRTHQGQARSKEVSKAQGLLLRIHRASSDYRRAGREATHLQEQVEVVAGLLEIQTYQTPS